MTTSETGIFGVLAEGAAGYSRGVSNRDAARVRKARSDAIIKKLNYEEQTGSMQVQVDALKQQNIELSRQMSQKNVFSALQAYTADFDTKHINHVIKTDANMKRSLKDIVSIDKLDVFNDMQLIRDAGLNLTDFQDEETAKNASGRYLKMIDINGKKQVLDMQKVYAGTGYTKQLAKGELEDLLKKMSLTKKLKGKGPTAMTRKAMEYDAAKQRIKEAEEQGIDPDTKDTAIVQFGQAEIGGKEPGKLTIAQEYTEELLKDFGGEDQFFATDFSNRKNYNKAYKNIIKIEQLEDATLSSRTKSDINDIRVLLALGEPGKELTDKETGWMDSFFVNTKKYIFDNAKGIAATSAYSAFRNSVRHALYGAALTEAEIISFKEAFGTLGQKLGPVVQQFKTSILQVKAKLESIANMQNPYSAHVRLGVDQQRLDKIISELDKRLELMETAGLEAPKVEKTDGLKGLGGKVK